MTDLDYENWAKVADGRRSTTTRRAHTSAPMVHAGFKSAAEGQKEDSGGRNDQYAAYF